MTEQFRRAGLHYILPFNKTPSEYSADSDALLHHCNPHRVAWVMAHANLKEPPQ
jgi:hypothetical protein